MSVFAASDYPLPFRSDDRELPLAQPVRIWLWLVALLVVVMVIVGGATRLTDSGLSITEWKPLLGAIPPLNAQDWDEAFQKYRQIPEYLEQNKGMSLDEFKFIYWWEWGHRQLGRFIGVAFAIPYIVFAMSGLIQPGTHIRFLGLMALGGLQGAIGWWMVSSGLVDRLDVSQYRLAVHLTLAFIILACLIWVSETGRGKQHVSVWHYRFAVGLLFLVFFQLALGAFVAGIDAGLVYNSWPLMGDTFVPPDLFVLDPWWIAFFEDPRMVQLQHRLVAYALFAAFMLYAFWSFIGDRPKKKEALLLAVLVFLQAAIGVWTLLSFVALPVALLHQGGAAILVIALIVHIRSMKSA